MKENLKPKLINSPFMLGTCKDVLKPCSEVLYENVNVSNLLTFKNNFIYYDWEIDSNIKHKSILIPSFKEQKEVINGTRMIINIPKPLNNYYKKFDSNSFISSIRNHFNDSTRELYSGEFRFKKGDIFLVREAYKDLGYESDILEKLKKTPGYNQRTRTSNKFLKHYIKILGVRETNTEFKLYIQLLN